MIDPEIQNAIVLTVLMLVMALGLIGSWPWRG